MAESTPNDLSVFSSSQIDLVNEILEDSDIKSRDITIEKVGKPGDYYSSEVKIMKVKDDEETFNIIVKLAPKVSGDDNPLTFGLNIFFNNEIIMYTEVLERMTQLQLEAGIDIKDTIKYAKCYGAIRDTQDEMILLEDLTKESYVMMDKLQPLSNEAFRAVIKYLASFHSLSYVLKNKAPEEFSDFCEILIDLNTFEVNEECQNSLVEFGNKFSELFERPLYKHVIKELFTEHFRNNYELANADKVSKQSVIIHGDCWTNNIMFRLKDGVPSDCILIDFQLARESLPVADVLYLLLNCTDYDARAKHRLDWIDYYYNSLKENLAVYRLQLGEIYPKDKFDADMRRYHKAYFSTAILSASVLLRKTRESAILKDALNEVKSVDDVLGLISIDDLNDDTLQTIKKRIDGLLESCLDNGCINIECGEMLFNLNLNSDNT